MILRIQDTGFRGQGKERQNLVRSQIIRSRGAADQLAIGRSLGRTVRQLLESLSVRLFRWQANQRTVEEPCCFANDVHCPRRVTTLLTPHFRFAGLGVAILESRRHTSYCDALSLLAVRYTKRQTATFASARGYCRSAMSCDVFWPDSIFAMTKLKSMSCVATC